MRVFVTGATGFLGSHIVELLTAAGHDVRALVRGESRRVPGAECRAGDVLDRASLDAAVAGCDAVVHAAADLTFKRSEFARQREVNVQGTRNLVEAARAAGVKRFVHTSSVSALGRPANGPADESARYDWPVGLNYNETKRDAEEIVRNAPLEAVVVNPALVLGPNDRAHRSLPFLKAVRRGLIPLAPPGGVTVCDVRDVAAAHVSALERGAAGERYILGGPTLTFVELLGEVARAVDGRPPIGTLPPRVILLGALPLVLAEKLGAPLPLSPHYYPYLTVSAYYSSEKAKAQLGYRTRPAAETIGDTTAWYRSEGLL